MMLAEVIREAGFSVEKFPNASRIPVTYYDRKDRVVDTESIQFVEPLFAHSESGKAHFEKLLVNLEKAPLSSFNVRIDESMVAMFYKSPHVKIFLRHYMEPMDYME